MRDSPHCPYFSLVKPQFHGLIGSKIGPNPRRAPVAATRCQGHGKVMRKSMEFMVSNHESWCPAYSVFIVDLPINNGDFPIFSIVFLYV